MQPHVLIDIAIVQHLIDKMRAAWPNVYSHSYNGNKIANQIFIEQIVRAYPYAMQSIGARYHGYSSSENTRAWSTPWFKAIRNQIPEYNSLYDMSGVGYKYRDVIWVILALLKQGADNGLTNFRNLHRCLEITERPENVLFMTAGDMDTFRERDTQPIVNPQPGPFVPDSDRRSGEDIIPAPSPSDPIPSRRNLSGMPLLLIGAAAVAAVLILGQD